MMHNGDISDGPKRVKKLHSSDYDRLMKSFTGFEALGGFVSLHPGNFILPQSFVKYHEKVYNFQFRGDDVMIMTFPKCGTTWTQEIVWTMRHNPNLDNPKESAIPINVRCPFLEADMLMDELEGTNPFKISFDALCPGKDPKDGMILQMTDAMPEKRVIKTHLPFSFYDPSLLDTCKVIFVSRDPLDVISSFYHHCRLINIIDFKGSFDEFFTYFVEDEVFYGPFWKTIHEVMEKLDHPNLLCIKYEEMIANPLKEILKIDHFIGTNLDEKQLNDIVHYTSFNEMKVRHVNELAPQIVNVEIMKKDGGFFRKGKSGTGKNVLTENQRMKLDIWIKKNTLGKRSPLSKIISL